ncbi:MAG: NrfD/PsrC family molybdoenzyme membrane anchor subunit [Myxococcota bacterium]
MIPELTGYLFPNDVHIHWSLMIVMYPYITGLVAGAFVVSSLYHVFNREELKPVGRFALTASFCFLLVATLPLVSHLGATREALDGLLALDLHEMSKVFRAFNIIVTPHFSSAMAGFGILYASYFVVVMLELWFVFRTEIIRKAIESRGFARRVYAVLALGVYDTSEEAQRYDHNIVRVLAAIGIPMACLLHGYVGFLFGAIKANPWWSTPLMPVIFLFSAVVSGIAVLIVLYQIAMKLKGMPIQGSTVASMARYLWLFMILSLTLEVLEIVTLAYERAEEWEVIGHLLVNQLSVSFISVQMVIGGLIPFILLMITVLMEKYLHDRLRNTLTMVASLLLLLQVLSMRWNVVIGGQMFSKSMRGFRETYVPEMFAWEGVVHALVILLIPFVLLVVFEYLFPNFDHLRKADSH